MVVLNWQRQAGPGLSSRAHFFINVDAVACERCQNAGGFYWGKEKRNSVGDNKQVALSRTPSLSTSLHPSPASSSSPTSPSSSSSSSRHDTSWILWLPKWRLGSARSTCPPRLDTRRVDNFNARISDVPRVLVWFPLGERLCLKVAQHIAASPAFISRRRRAHRRWSHCCGGDEEDAADFRGEPGVSFVCLQSKPLNAPRSCNV